MIVADEHLMDRRQVLQPQPCGALAPYAEARHLRDGVTEDRIGQKIPPQVLDEEAGMPDPGYLEARGISRRVDGLQIGRYYRSRYLRRRQAGQRGVRDFFGPQAELPPQDLGQADPGLRDMVVVDHGEEGKGI